MKYFLLIAVFIVPVSCFAQYRGGVNDGVAIGNASIANALPNIYNGGINDGHASISLTNQNSTPGIYFGGINDGVASISVVGANALPGIYLGGINDGVASTSISGANAIPGIYFGGINDGVAFASIAGANAVPSIYFGGINDGVAFATITNANAFPGIYAGGINDGTALFAALNQNQTVSGCGGVPTPTITPGGPTTFCFGGNVQLCTPTASGYTYQWKLNGVNIIGATSLCYTATTSGTYKVIITNAGAGCVDSSSGTIITVNPLPSTTVTITGNTTFCHGGSAQLCAPAGFSYQWKLNGSNFATTQCITVTAAGTYNVIVTNTTTGCVDSSAGTPITVNPLPSTTVTTTGNTTFCQGGSAQLCAPVGFSYQWKLNGSNFAATQCITVTAAGTYKVIVTNTSTGCVDSSAGTPITVNPLPSTIVTPASPIALCSGGSVQLCAPNVSGMSYQWRLNGANISGATAQCNTVSTAGTYKVVVTNSSTSCLDSSSGTVVTVSSSLPTPTINPSGTLGICAGNTITLSSSSTTGNQWYVGGSLISGATAQTLLVNATGNYTVVVSSGSCSSAASAATTINVNSNPSTPTISAGGPTTFCQGGSVTLTSSSASGNQWYLGGNIITGATAQTLVVNASGSYTVIVTASGCSSSASAATPVTVNPIPSTPTISAGGPTTFCAGDSVTLTSSSASGNQWYLGGNIITGATSQNYVANASGNYTVIVTASGCGSAASTATTVTVNPTPATPTITPSGTTAFCAGQNTTLTSSTATGNQWYVGGNIISGATAQTYVATAAGSYTVVVTASGCGSAASAATTVNVNALPATTVTPASPIALCSGGSVQLCAPNVSGMSYQWRLNGANISGATAQCNTVSTAGTYKVVVTNSSTSCLDSSSGTVVTVSSSLPTPTINPSGTLGICAGNTITLSSSSTTGNQWYVGGSLISGATAQTLLVNATGNYTVVVSSGSCSSAASAATTINVNSNPSTPTISAGGPTTFCQGGSVTLTSSSASGNQWYLGGNIITGATAQTLVVNASGSYTVIVTASGCSSSASAATPVTVNPIPSTPTISAGGPTTFCAGDSVTLTSSSASGNQWYLGGNIITGATSQNYVANASGNYTVIVTASGCGSAASTAATVTVNPTPATPTITPSGTTTFCTGGSVTLSSSSATDNQWYQNGNPITGATSQNYLANASGSYTVVVATSGCNSASSAAVTVAVNTFPATPTISAGGPTTFCQGGSVALTSSSATGDQWYLNGNIITGATSQNYVANASGNYTVIVTSNGCSSASSAATTVTVNTVPPPTITPSGSVSFTTSGVLTSSATLNQWYFNSNVIVGATAQTNTAAASGSYTVTTTNGGCTSAPSAATVVTITSGPGNNPPVVSGNPTNDTVNLVVCNQVANLAFTTTDPNAGQNVTTTVTSTMACGMTTSTTGNGTSSNSTSIAITALGCNYGRDTITITATDNGSPAVSTIRRIIVNVSDSLAPVITYCPSNMNFNIGPNDGCSIRVYYSPPVATDNCAPCGMPAFSPYVYIGTLGGHEYYLATAHATWSAHNAYAQSVGGHLVTITSATENSFVAAGMNGGACFTGLNDAATEGTFVWANGEPNTYTSWCSGEPNNLGNEDYGMITTNTGNCWNDIGGSYLAQAIVEYDCITTSLKFALSNPATGNAQYFPIGTSTVTYIVTDSFSNSDTCSFTVTVNDPNNYCQGATLRAYQSSAFDVSVYPNPFRDGVHLRFESSTFSIADVSVTDVTGRILEIRRSQHAKEEITLGRELSAGVYFIEVRNGEASQKVRVVKY